ncbi:MAG TPA: hypothetical protein VF062_08100 [Candidatus Limnocylindrales bacterium]
MEHPLRHSSFARALSAIQEHQQGHHGWSILHAAIHHLHAAGHTHLHDILDACWMRRPHISDSHLITLVSIALREIVLKRPVGAIIFRPEYTTAERTAELATLLAEHRGELVDSICHHSNSFTGARRFIVPQLVIGAFASAHRLTDVRFLDLGTGLGILPRQLNQHKVFHRFAADLRWNGLRVGYREIPLSLRHGVDADPLPSLDWVRTCFGPSAYYEERFEELVWSLEQTAQLSDEITISALNILELDRLHDYIRLHRFNAITCSFVLYQYDEEIRHSIVATVVKALEQPGVLVSMEPSHDGLVRQGCRVEAYLAGGGQPVHLADVSDAHFIGRASWRRRGLETLRTSWRAR